MHSNINHRAVLQTSRFELDGQSSVDHIYTMAFIASPWEFPDTFHRIPQLVIRALVDPASWDVVAVDARLVFGSKFADILLPSRYILTTIHFDLYRGCDLRLQREEFLPIPAAESIGSFKRFLEETRFDPSRNRLLTAPPFLELDVGSENAPSTSVRYFLMQMDFRKEVRRRFSGQELIYADIDGGDAWGRRREVSMVVTEGEDNASSLGATIGALELLLSKACS
jgi:hypothetical protein